MIKIYYEYEKNIWEKNENKVNYDILNKKDNQIFLFNNKRDTKCHE